MAAGILLCATTGRGLGQDPITVTIGPSKDNTIFRENPTHSSGLGVDLFTGKTGINTAPSNILRRALLAFDVAGGVPAGSTVLSASLTLTVTQVAMGSPPPANHVLRRVSADWGEGTSLSPLGNGVDATTGDATWNHRFYDTDSWTTSGGDFVGTISASTTVGTSPGDVTWSSTQLTADVQDFLDDPDSNFGWILFGDEVNNQSTRKIASKDAPANQPALVIEYLPPPPVLRIARSGASNVELRWASVPSGFEPESSGTLGGDSWSAVGGMPAPDGDDLVLTLPLSGPVLFFRLNSP